MVESVLQTNEWYLEGPFTRHLCLSRHGLFEISLKYS